MYSPMALRRLRCSWAFSIGLLATPVAAGAAGLPGGLELTSEHDEVAVRGARRVTHLVVSATNPLTFTIEGPSSLELRVLALVQEPAPEPAEVTVLLERDGEARAMWDAELDVSKRIKVKPPELGFASAFDARHLEIEEGTHTFKVQVVSADADQFAIGLAPLRRVRAKLALSDWEPLETPEPEPEPEPEPQPEPAPEPDAAAVDEEEPPADDAPQSFESESVVTEDSEAPAPPEPTPPAKIEEPEPIEADGTVAGGSRALADAIARGFAALGRDVAFHRVAIPAFKELSEDVAENKLGGLVSELLAAELAQREPFVVVERERLDAIMREHRLNGLGMVDPDTAAEFGQIMGAQSILTGTVGEAGPQYVVTCRLVEVESGAALAAAQVPIDKAGMVALSDEAVVTRSVMGAVARSALIPGWGQIYNRQPVKGYVLLGVGAAVLIAAGVEAVLGLLSSMDYQNPSNVSPEFLRSARETANARYTEANYLFIGYGVVWAFGVIDALIFGEDYEGIELDTSTEAGVAAGGQR